MFGHKKKRNKSCQRVNCLLSTFHPDLSGCFTSLIGWPAFFVAKTKPAWYLVPGMQYLVKFQHDGKHLKLLGLKRVTFCVVILKLPKNYQHSLYIYISHYIYIYNYDQHMHLSKATSTSTGVVCWLKRSSGRSDRVQPRHLGRKQLRPLLREAGFFGDFEWEV